MSSWKNKDTDVLCDVLLSLRNRAECYALLEDLCTIREVQDMAQRLAVAKMLDNGVSYTEICRTTGVSTATVSRISRCYSYGAGGYKTVIDRLARSEEEDKQ